MISITNNAASIQLNGDRSVTIIKKDVTKVIAIGINVLIVEKLNGRERKTSIPFSQVNVPQNYPTSQALADYISSILGGFDTSAYIENTIGSYVAQVTTSPFIVPNATAVLKDTANNILSNNSIPSAVPSDVTAPDGTVTAVNSDNSFSQSQAVLSGGVANLNLPDITVNESDGSTRTQPSNTTVNCIPVTPLTVDFSVDDATPDTNQVITFTDLTVGATAYVWNFGDGTTSNLQNPTKSYRFAGTYTVTLAAENGGSGGIETKVNFIVVTLQTIIQTGLQAHYKAMTGAIPANATLVAGAISQWNDATVNVFNLTQGGATARPLYTEVALTAPDGTVYGSSDSDGSNDNLANSSVLLTRVDNHCCYIFMKQTNFVSAVRTFLRSTTGLMLLQIEANSLSFRICAITAYNSSIRNEYCLVKATFSSTAAATQINDGDNINVGAGSITAGDGFAIGAANNTSGNSVIECALYSNIPSAGDDADIIKYFNSKFGGVICS